MIRRLAKINARKTNPSKKQAKLLKSCTVYMIKTQLSWEADNATMNYR